MTAQDASARFDDIRIAVFSDAFAHRNGVGAYYCDLLGHLGPRLGAAALICPGATPEGKQQGLSIPLPGDATQKLCLPGLLKASRAMGDIRPNVVVLATPGPYGLLGLLLAWWWGAQVCVGYHTQFDQLVSLYWSRAFGVVGAWYLRLLDRVLFRLSGVVVTNSGPMRDAAQRLGAQDVRLVGTPLEPRLLTPPVAHAHTAFGPVLFVGRLAPEKNLDAVIDAARRMPETRFIIAGDGPLAPMVRGAAAALPNLDYRGWLEREALLRTLDEAEALVVPSRVESFGTVAIEAMARRRLVLVSADCGIRDWPGLVGGLELMGTGERLADALGRVAVRSSEERAAKAGVARVRAEAFARDTVDQWLAILARLARSSPVFLAGRKRAEALE